ncbi:MAG: RnfH family protein [Betaproteobacteria bacterium]|nr:RnfH family protein [Betaproteobacteria bacterium]
MKIILIRAWPDRHDEQAMELPEDATLAVALTRSGWRVDADAAVGVWGKVQPRDRVLRDGDRVEIYRPLVADPKTARRKRAIR